MNSLPTSWLSIPTDSDFSIHNLPYGVFSTSTRSKRIGVAIGSYILDLKEAETIGFFKKLDFDADTLRKKKLNDFMAQGRPVWQRVRRRIQEILTQNHEFSGEKWVEKLLVPQAEATMHLPVKIGDYTDFYSSEEHATNVGRLFRPDNPLMPNWKYMPVAYHGRASSIVISETPFHRPKGQIRPNDHEPPLFLPTRTLDFELEIAAIIGKSTELGQSVSTDKTDEYVFGFVLFNDWSTRDIQRWEYQPLGPFLAKNFCSSISPWVVTMEALEPFRVASPLQEPDVFPYLKCTESWNFDINLQVAIEPENEVETTVCRTNYKGMYWMLNK